VTSVSVVIPAFNAAGTLAQTIESVLAQTHQPTEVVVIDDGSTDASAEVAERFPSPVTCVRTPNAGVSRARNTGIERAAGEYVAFLDADDLWRPEKLERQLEALAANKQAEVSTSGRIRVDADLNEIERTGVADFEDACESLLLQSMALGPVSSIVARRELLTDLGGFDLRFSQCADWDLMLRLSLRTGVAAVDEPLVLYRTTPENMSSNIELLERDTFAVLDRFYAGDPPARYRALRRRAYSNHWLIVSGSYFQAGQPRAAARALARAVRARPAAGWRALGLPYRRLKRRVQTRPA
jgi:glycosyltransferase involved in cell wall biosynthesis